LRQQRAFGQPRHQTRGAVDRVALLVSGDDQHRRALPARRDPARGGGNPCRNRALHVGRSAPDQPAICHTGCERRRGPVSHIAGRHDIAVARERQPTPRPVTHRDQIVDRAEARPVHLKTERGERRREHIERARIGGRHTGAADQRLRKAYSVHRTRLNGSMPTLQP